MPAATRGKYAAKLPPTHKDKRSDANRQVTRPLMRSQIPRRTRSFQVAKTMSVSTSASPTRKPYSCARWPSGLPRMASAA